MIAIRIIDDSIKPKLFDAKTNPNPIKKLVININESNDKVATLFCLIAAISFDQSKNGFLKSIIPMM